MFKYLCQVDGTYHDFIRVIVWSILLIDTAIIGFSLAAWFNFTTKELKLIEEAIENYGSRCSNNEWRELLYKIRRVQIQRNIKCVAIK